MFDCYKNIISFNSGKIFKIFTNDILVTHWRYIILNSELTITGPNNLAKEVIN